MIKKMLTVHDRVTKKRLKLTRPLRAACCWLLAAAACSASTETLNETLRA